MRILVCEILRCRKLTGHALQALNTIPRERAEWFIWLDMDMVLENVTFDLPLETYEGRDIIMWGQPEWIAKGDNARGAHQLTSTVQMIMIWTMLSSFTCENHAHTP